MRAHVLELDAPPEAHPIIPLTTLVGFRSYSHQQLLFKTCVCVAISRKNNLIMEFLNFRCQAVLNP